MTRSQRNTFVSGHHLAAALVLASLSCAALFEALFLDASILSLDNRVFAPLQYHAATESGPRPMNVLTTDINSYVVPDTLTSLRQLAEGEPPLWNSCQLLGQPLMAGQAFSWFYPTAALYLVLDPLRALAVSIALHLLLLGYGTWLFLRSQALGWLPAMLGATAVMFCGFATNHWHMPGFLMAYAWLPWLLCAGNRLVRPPATRAAARDISVAGLTIAACLLAGAPQISALVITTAILASMGRWLLDQPTQQPVTSAGHASLAGVAACGLGLLTSAIAIAPSADVHRSSARAQLVTETGLHSEDHLEAAALIGFVLPRFYGDPVQDISSTSFDARPMEAFPTMRSWLSDHHQNNVIENTLWFGGVAFVLALLAVPRMLSTGHRFAGALFLVSLLMALGLPVLADIFGALPGIGIGSPKRLACLTMFAGAWLAATSLQFISDTAHRRSACGLRGAGLALIALSMAGALPFESWYLAESSPEDLEWFRGVLLRDLCLVAIAGLALLGAGELARRGRLTWALATLVTTVTAEGLYLSRAMNPPQAIEFQYESTPVMDWLREHGACDSHRIASFDDPGVLPGCLAQVFGIRSCTGYLPLASQATYEFFRALEPGIVSPDGRAFGAIHDTQTLASPLLDLVGARFLVTGVHGFKRLGEQPPHGLKLAYLNEQEQIAVYERPKSQPPAFLVSRVECVPDAESRLAILSGNEFAPAELALIEQPLPHDRGLGSGDVDYRRVDDAHIHMRATCSAPGFLVLTETYASGWRAEIDGTAAPVHRTNHALMGLNIPAGESNIDLYYEPTSFTWGAIASGLGLLISLALLALRRRSGAPPP